MALKAYRPGTTFSSVIGRPVDDHQSQMRAALANE
jgi:hypothetical protein